MPPAPILSPAIRLPVLAGITALAAIGATLALLGAGLPFVVAAPVSAIAAGLVQYAALPAPVAAPPPAPPPPATGDSDALRAQLDAYRAHTATMRHDLRGALAPALMMTDRLLNHADPAVQRAGQAMVRSIDRATAVLGQSRDFMNAPESGSAAPGAPAAPAPRAE